MELTISLCSGALAAEIMEFHVSITHQQIFEHMERCGETDGICDCPGCPSSTAIRDSGFLTWAWDHADERIWRKVVFHYGREVHCACGVWGTFQDVPGGVCLLCQTELREIRVPR